MDAILIWISGQMATARLQYGVNPVIFLGLIVACAPFFYYSIYRLVRAVAKKEKGRVALWSSVFLAATSLPYLYVLLFGRNLPWYIYGVFIALVGQGVYQLVKKIRR
jgi:hypothetical protein